jgi:pyruvate/2-oxoglutarate dehydrogenase complex dihydrolipoamide acyltransferase (E2) component
VGLGGIICLLSENEEEREAKRKADATAAEDAAKAAAEAAAGKAAAAEPAGAFAPQSLFAERPPSEATDPEATARKAAELAADRLMRLKLLINRGLVSAAVDTRSAIITTGFDHGAVRLIGEANKIRGHRHAAARPFHPAGAAARALRAACSQPVPGRVRTRPPRLRTAVAARGAPLLSRVSAHVSAHSRSQASTDMIRPA